MQLECAILWRHLWPLWLYHIFRHYLINCAIIEKMLLNIKCVFSFFKQLLSKIFLIIKEFSEISSQMSKRLHVKYPLFLSDFNETWISSIDFWRKLKYQVSSKSVQWEPSCSLRTDIQTDMTNLKVAFRNFAKAPKKLEYRQYLTSDVTTDTGIFSIRTRWTYLDTGQTVWTEHFVPSESKCLSYRRQWVSTIWQFYTHLNSTV
jgi:hypothetical protein